MIKWNRVEFDRFQRGVSDETFSVFLGNTLKQQLISSDILLHLISFNPFKILCGSMMVDSPGHFLRSVIFILSHVHVDMWCYAWKPLHMFPWLDEGHHTADSHKEQESLKNFCWIVGLLHFLCTENCNRWYQGKFVTVNLYTIYLYCITLLPSFVSLCKFFFSSIYRIE